MKYPKSYLFIVSLMLFVGCKQKVTQEQIETVAIQQPDSTFVLGIASYGRSG